MSDTFYDPDYQAHIDATTGNFVTAPPDYANDANAPTMLDFLKQQFLNAGGADFEGRFDQFVHLYLGPRAQRPRPRTFDAFIQQWYSFAFSSPPSNTLTGTSTQFDGFTAKDFANSWFLYYGPASTSDLGYWTVFEGSTNVAAAQFLTPLGSIGTPSDAQRLAYAFENAFATFISDYQFEEIAYPNQGSNNYVPAGTDVNTPAAGSPIAAFQNGWFEWLKRTNIPSSLTTSPGGAQAIDQNMHVYETIFEAYLPGADPADFQREIIAFADRMFEKEGYFYPNHFVEQWTDELKSAALSGASRNILTPIKLEDRVQQALILNEIFELLVDMIGVIQQATAALAQRLRFYSEYQNQLANLMDQMHIFTPGDGTQLSGSSEKRGEANALSQAKLEHLRAFRDMVGDETKQLQTTVNQLNDAASQQGNIATAILQQLSGILTLIFR